MILSFKPQFIEPIMSGQKIHTIREDLGNRWHEGRQIEFATGVRTKQYRQFKAGRCLFVQRFEIWKHANQLYRFNESCGFLTRKVSDDNPKLDEPAIVIDNYLLKKNTVASLAFQDGFNSIEDFYSWFLPLIDEKPVPDNGNQVWVGKIIHWTDYRY